MENCPTCRGKFGTQRNILLETIFDSVLVDCKNNGCNEKIFLKEKSTHEINCNFRQISCFCLKCESTSQQQNLSFIGTHLMNVYDKYQFKEHHLNDPKDEFQVDPDEDAMIYYEKKLLYIFVAVLMVSDLKHVYKNCLIAIATPDEAKKLKCHINLIYNKKEIITFNGNVFSIDETKGIRLLDSGGLIIPEEIFDKKILQNSTVNIKVTEID